MSRVFLMKWYHFSVEYFEDLRNVNHCEFLIMRKSIDSGKYILENKLRTWSELKRERALAQKEKEREKGAPSSISTSVSEKDKEKEKRLGAASTSPAIPTRKRWGGCPNGCDHGKHSFRKENSMHAMQLNGKPTLTAPNTTLTPSPLAVPDPTIRRPPTRRWQSSSEEDSDDPRGRVGPAALDVQKAREEAISSPDGTPSFISVEDRLRHRVKRSGDGFLLSVGRDFGGSASGHTSVAGSETEEEVGGRAVAVKVKSLKGVFGKGATSASGREESGMGRGALADALGDQSDVGSDAGSEFEDLERAEKEDKGLRGSVY
jgi:hypothetical protein